MSPHIYITSINLTFCTLITGAKAGARRRHTHNDLRVRMPRCARGGQVEPPGGTYRRIPGGIRVLTTRSIHSLTDYSITGNLRVPVVLSEPIDFIIRGTAERVPGFSTLNRRP